MKKNFSFFIFSIVFLFQLPVYAKNSDNEIVDLYDKHWAFQSVKIVLDKYKLMQGFPDHTFRGQKRVTRYEFSVIILNLIRFLEEERKTSLKCSKRTLFNEKVLAGIQKNSWAFPTILELRNNYNIILSPEFESSFGGIKNINRFELSHAIDQVISLIPQKSMMEKNPYVAESSPSPEIKIKENIEEWADKSVKNMINSGIMFGYLNADDFRGKREVTRFELSSVLVKAIEYTKKIE